MLLCFCLFFDSFGPLSFSRAYINFKNRDDIIKFRDQFDGYCFVDGRGNPFFFFSYYGNQQTVSLFQAVDSRNE